MDAQVFQRIRVLEQRIKNTQESVSKRFYALKAVAILTLVFLLGYFNFGKFFFGLLTFLGMLVSLYLVFNISSMDRHLAQQFESLSDFMEDLEESESAETESEEEATQ